MASNFSPMFFEQPIVIFDTTQSLNSTSGSFVLYGGVSINATYQSTTTSTGAFVLSGGMGIQKQLSVGGITTIYNTTESEGTNSGALVVAGGVGIAKNLHVGEDTFIGGNLYVNGITTSVNSTTINVVDNTFTLNSGPAGSRDAGFLIQRFQESSDSGAGDVVGANEPVVLSGVLASGGTGSVTFATTDAALNPTGWWIKVTSGATVYARKVSSSSNTGTVVTANFLDLDTYTDPQGVSQLTHNDEPFTSAVSSADSFALYNRNYVAQYYDEANDEYIMGYISHAQDIQTALQKTDLLNIRSKGLYATNSTITNLSVSALTAGNIGLDQATILSTFVVTGTTTLASLMVSGGSQVGGTLTVSGASTLNNGITAGSLNVTGESLLHGAVTAGALAVTGQSLLRLGVTAGSLNVTGESWLQGAVTAGGLNVTGQSLLQLGVSAGSLNVTGESWLQGAVTAGALNVTGQSLLQLGVSAGSLNVTGESWLQGAVTAGGLNVTGQSLLQLGVSAGSLNVTGESWLQGAVTAGGLNVTGQSLLQLGVSAGSLNVTGESWLQGAVTAGALNVTGQSLLQLGVSAGSLNVTGESWLQGAVTAGGLNVTGQSLLQLGVSAGSLNVTGESWLQGAVTAGGLNVTGQSLLQLGVSAGSLNVTGESWLQGAVTAGGLNVTGESLLQLGVSAGSLNVTGESWLQGAVTAGGLNVTGQSLLQLGLTGGSLNITGESWLQGAVTAGALAVTGQSLLRLGASAGSLNVTGESWLQGAVTAGALNVTGQSLLQLGVTAGSLNVTGESTLHANVTMGSNAVVVGPAFQIPYGDTASRPTPAQDGYIRYNTEYSSFEGYGPGDAWGSLGGVIDIAQTTKILASASPNVTDGNLYFYTKGVEYMRINSAGNIGIHTTVPNYTLDVIGTLGVSVGVTTGSLNVTGASIMEDNLTVTTGSVIISTNDYTPIINATSATGGSIIFNSVDVSPSMGDISRERSFNSANNVSSASNITGFAFSNAIVRAFDAVLSVTILSSEGNKYAYYNLKGVQKGSNWVINSSYVGDVTGYTFSITNAGQVQYTSTDVDGWTSATINFRALTTTI
jgi:hypothetical protein